MANYNSTLQTNNTDLQAILNKVNALPEAGSSGSGGGLQIATGTFTPSSAMFNGKTFSVTGLGFEPSLVCIQLAYSSSNTTIGYDKNKVLIGSYFKQGEQYHSYIGLTSAVTSAKSIWVGYLKDSAEITVNSDGFSLSGKDSSCTVASCYRYVAIR